MPTPATIKKHLALARKELKATQRQLRNAQIALTRANVELSRQIELTRATETRYKSQLTHERRVMGAELEKARTTVVAFSKAVSSSGVLAQLQRKQAKRK